MISNNLTHSNHNGNNNCETTNNNNDNIMHSQSSTVQKTLKMILVTLCSDGSGEQKMDSNQNGTEPQKGPTRVQMSFADARP